MTAKPAVEPQAYTIKEFCQAFRFSQASYFKLKREGKGPREMKIGTRVLITVEAAQEWARKCESAGASQSAA
jgi:hypothetical protein